jgi:hypothetical protein
MPNRATLEQGHELHEVLTNAVDIGPPSASTSNAASNTETSTSNAALNAASCKNTCFLEHGLLKGTYQETKAHLCA